MTQQKILIMRVCNGCAGSKCMIDIAHSKGGVGALPQGQRAAHTITVAPAALASCMSVTPSDGASERLMPW